MNLNEIEFNINVFEEVDAKQAHLKSRSTLRPIPASFTLKCEKDFRHYSNFDLIEIIIRNDSDNLRIVAFAIVIMQKRYSSNFLINGGCKKKKEVYIKIFF